MQETVDYISPLDYETRSQACIPFESYADLVTCPFGKKRVDDEALTQSCQMMGLECPPGNLGCFCQPCLQICKENEHYTTEGVCRCKNLFMWVGTSCIRSSTFWAFLAVGVLGAIALLVALMRCCKRDDSNLWVIKPEELRFDSTPVR